jgi:phosphotransferase system HPr (HPr) family protein
MNTAAILVTLGLTPGLCALAIGLGGRYPHFEAASAAKLVQSASQFTSRISLVADEKTANAKSIMGIISMELSSGSTVTIVADGEDEAVAVPTLEGILGGTNG